MSAMAHLDAATLQAFCKTFAETPEGLIGAEIGTLRALNGRLPGGKLKVL